MQSEILLASGKKLNVRDAQSSDLPAIVDVYNQSIPGGWSTADTSPISVESRLEWFSRFSPTKRPIWVAEAITDLGPPEIAAWVSLTSFYAGRPAYDATAEISLYIAIKYQRQGIGYQLKKLMIDQCPSLGVTTVLSMYFDHNRATQSLNDRLGFLPMGHLTEIANISGVKRGLIISALRIPDLK